VDANLALEVLMDILAERLDAKLREWSPETADQVRRRVAEMIEFADQDALDLLRSRVVEQEVLDSLDDPAAR
jgi:ribose 1,5-bisphosphokinase PhnN